MRISKYAIYEIILFHVFVVLFALTFPEKDAWSVTIFLLCMVVALMVLEYLRTRLFVSPLFFWFAFWLGAIILGRMHLGIGVYPLYQEWSVRLLRIIVFNTLVFFWAYGLGEWRWKRTFGKKPDRQPGASETELLADLVILLLILASVSYAMNVFTTGVIPQLTGDANSYRNSFVATRYYQIVGLLRFVVACVPPAVKCTRSGVKKTVLIVLTGMYLLEEMLTGWRGYTLQAMILLMTSVLLISDTESAKARKRNALIIFSTGLLAVAFIVYITVTRDGSFEAVEVRIKYAIDNFYLYVAPNFLNFQTAVEKVQPKGFLMYSVEALWGFIMPAWENPLYIWDDVEYSIGAYNVCTYLLEPFCDLGTGGTLLWSSLIAFFSGKMFAISREKKTVLSIVAVGIANITIFMLHNNFFLRSSSVLIWLVAGAGLGWLTRKRSTPFYGKEILQKKYSV